MSTTETSANLQRKRGPEPDFVRAQMRAMFPEWSERHFATWWKAFSSLTGLKRAGLIEEAEVEAAMQAAARPNGSVNVSKFAREADAMVFRLVMEGKL